MYFLRNILVHFKYKYVEFYQCIWTVYSYGKKRELQFRNVQKLKFVLLFYVLHSTWHLKEGVSVCLALMLNKCNLFMSNCI